MILLWILYRNVLWWKCRYVVEVTVTDKPSHKSIRLYCTYCTYCVFIEIWAKSKHFFIVFLAFLSFVFESADRWCTLKKHFHQHFLQRITVVHIKHYMYSKYTNWHFLSISVYKKYEPFGNYTKKVNNGQADTLPQWDALEQVQH